MSYYDQLNLQFGTSDAAQDMSEDTDDPHFNKILTKEDVQRILDLPATAFIATRKEKDAVDILKHDSSENVNNIFPNFGSAKAIIDLDMENVFNDEQTLDYPGPVNCLYEVSGPKIQRNSTRTTSFSSFNSTDTNSADDIDYWLLEPPSIEAGQDIADFLVNGSDDYEGLGEIPSPLAENEQINASNEVNTKMQWLTESSEATTNNAESNEKELCCKVEDDIENNFTKYRRCSVCSKPALKHSSYGGQVCSSCRSFFRRAAQSGYHAVFHCKQKEMCKMDPKTRKKCQFCRFQSCLRSGMKITWVLSDQERKRRYGKLKTVKKEVTSESINMLQSFTRPSVLVFSFSSEEKNIMEDLCTKFHVPWLENLFKFNRDAGFNLIEFVFLHSEPRSETWKAFNQSMSMNFMKLILPRFEELSDLSPSDIGQLMNSPPSGIAQLFRSCHMFNMEGRIQGKQCPVPSHVVGMFSNPDIVSSLELGMLVSRLDLTRGLAGTRMAEYDDLYPGGWAGDVEAERRHREAVYKIVRWPVDDQNRFDYWMVLLMSLILVFHADYHTLVNRDRVEKIQLKYIMILHRYLRSKMKTENANKKFLEAMLLLNEAREAWKISCDFIR